MKAKWCMACKIVIPDGYKRCPKCGSVTIQNVARLVKDPQNKKRTRRLTLQQLGWWAPKIILITLALMLSGCSKTTAKYEDGAASITRIRILMTEDIDSFVYDATDGSFILEGYKSDLTRALDLIKLLVDKDLTNEQK